MTNSSHPWRGSRQKVLLFDHTAALGGGEIALINLVRHLDRTKVEPVVILGSDGPLAEHLRPLVETHVMPLSRSVATQRKDGLGIRTLFRFRDVVAVLAYVRRLARFIREHDVQLVHTNSLKADIVGGIAARLSSRPVVWHVRDRIEDDYLPASVARIFRLLCRAVPTYVIANSAATLRTLHLGQAARSTAIPSGVELQGWAAVVHDGTSTDVPPSKTRTTAGPFRVGLIGRISPGKGSTFSFKLQRRHTSASRR